MDIPLHLNSLAKSTLFEVLRTYREQLESSPPEERAPLQRRLEALEQVYQQLFNRNLYFRPSRLELFSQSLSFDDVVSLRSVSVELTVPHARELVRLGQEYLAKRARAS